MELEIIKHVTSSMWLMFALGNIIVISFCWMNQGEEGLHKYFKLTLKNVVFHIFSSIAVLLLLEELGAVLITNYIPSLANSGMYHGALSTLSGMFGSVFAAWIIQGVVKKFTNKKSDENNAT